MDMTPLQASCWRGKFLKRIQSGTPSTIWCIDDGAVGVKNLDIMLLCSRPKYKKSFWTNADLLSVELFGINFSEICIQVFASTFWKM